MKTFSDYINEKQNFIFGGKAGLTGKEYGNAKIFSSLGHGDVIYFFEFDKNEKKITYENVLTIESVKIEKNRNNSLDFIGRWEGNDNARARIEGKNVDKSIQIKQSVYDDNCLVIWTADDIDTKEIVDMINDGAIEIIINK